ncbi:hypothetical protein [Curtobacterium sp. VKM Ac-2884]|uniref:hypothetical protein n=1 Tax=Curtobacterium sp. VKM Ac-2884 TaxID=2783818 RepID=UPI00188DA44F|nr:hypothetical protein [Curtobacterium sp. VKM Ac-2884]MBF4605565.1 hypothetical protein [Curtobacterium sp. VKM Ac-2884]
MLAGILLALIGLGDVVRARTGADAHQQRTLTTIAVVVLWAGVSAVARLGLGVPVWSVLVTVVLAAAWIAATAPVRAGTGTADDDRDAPTTRGWLRRSGSWPAVLLAVAVAVLLLWGPLPDATGFVVDWHDGSGLAFVDAVPLAAVVGGVGSALFLVDSANVVVAQALPPGLQRGAVTGAEADDLRRRFGRRRRSDADAEQSGDSTVRLKGGRLIGPIERLLLAGFAVAGAFPVVAALIAAKGIVRFPEIRRETSGYQAEYFLIGSLVSWAMAFAAAGMCWLLAHS